MKDPNQRTDVTTQLSPLLSLTHTTEYDGQVFAVRVERDKDGEAPFDVEKKSWKSEACAATIYISPETAMKLATQILKHVGFDLDFKWETQLLAALATPPPIPTSAIGYDEPSTKSGAV